MKKDGGPAFPHDDVNSAGNYHKPHPGMSLRDWFAGQALATGLSGLAAGGWHNPSDYQLTELARMSFAAADAMLKERSL